MTQLCLITLAGFSIYFLYMVINLGKLKRKNYELDRNINRLQNKIIDLDDEIFKKIFEVRRKVHVDGVCAMLFSYELIDILFQKEIITESQRNELIERWRITEEEYATGNYNPYKEFNINRENQ